MATTLNSKHKRHLAQQNIISEPCTLTRNTRVSCNLFVVWCKLYSYDANRVILATGGMEWYFWCLLFFCKYTFFKEESVLSIGVCNAPGHIQHHSLLAFWVWTQGIFWDVQLFLQPAGHLPDVLQPSALSYHAAGSPTASYVVGGNGVVAWLSCSAPKSR